MCGKRHSNELIYNLKGLVTLHVKWKAGSKSPHAQQRNLTVIVSSFIVVCYYSEHNGSLNATQSVYCSLEPR